ncbi:MAG: hypothetical protein ACI8PZ_006868 [Myxococcota bacterium]|jgi:hypothetical protein
MPDVQAWLAARGADEPWWEQMMLNAVALAGTGRARAVGTVGADVLLLELEDGRKVGLSVLVQPIDAHPSGDPADVQSLIGALNTTFGDQRYVLYIRRRLPGGLDPENIARAVRLWLAAVERGEWQGRHAVYEDDDVAIELTLVGDAPAGGRSLMFMVGPVRALEQLTALDARLVDLVDRHAEDAPGLPVIYCVGCTAKASLARGYIQQLLYGTADTISAANDAWRYEASFSHSGRSLFSDPACASIASLWWLDPIPDAAGFRSMALDNPWVADGLVVQIDGTRFQVVEDSSADVVLRWNAPHPTRWSHE